MSAALGIAEEATVTISVTGIELLALKKLVIVSHALARTLGKSSAKAEEEQLLLTRTLNELVLDIETKAAARP